MRMAPDEFPVREVLWEFIWESSEIRLGGWLVRVIWRSSGVLLRNRSEWLLTPCLGTLLTDLCLVTLSSSTPYPDGVFESGMQVTSQTTV